MRAAPLALVLLTACVGRAREALHPIPDYAPAASETRGTAAAARAVSTSDRQEIFAEIVRQFFRPTNGQARWIDPKPLSHTRARAADSAAVEGDDWSEEIVQASRLGRVCALGDDPQCAGRPGSVLRFSQPYALGPDSALVFVRVSSVAAGERATSAAPGKGWEMEFRMASRVITCVPPCVPRRREWRIASKGTIVQSER